MKTGVKPTPPTCHPDRKAGGYGLCKSCYGKKYYKDNLDNIKAKAKESYDPVAAKKYYQEHRLHRLEQQQKYREANRDVICEKLRSRWTKYSYGISNDEYERMVEAQHGLCALCQKPPLVRKNRKRLLCVDHNHETGKIRGLLCDPCNIAIAYLKEDPNLFVKAIAYLEQNKD